MGYVERARDMVTKPVSKEVFEEDRIKTASIYKAFLSANITKENFRKELASINTISTENSVGLPFVGPLYGLLRRLGVSEKDSKKVSVEEKDHYLAAQNERVQIDGVRLIALRDSETNTNFIQSTLLISLPANLSNQETRNILKRIYTAPEEPSSSDLAKIP